MIKALKLTENKVSRKFNKILSVVIIKTLGKILKNLLKVPTF